MFALRTQMVSGALSLALPRAPHLLSSSSFLDSMDRIASPTRTPVVEESTTGAAYEAFLVRILAKLLFPWGSEHLGPQLTLSCPTDQWHTQHCWRSREWNR
jgi:hypothetical protein